MLTNQILSTLNPQYVKKIVDAASVHRHKAKEEDEGHDFIEITQEMKKLIEESDWITSKFKILLTPCRI